jgi:hypothetical protein
LGFKRDADSLGGGRDVGGLNENVLFELFEVVGISPGLTTLARLVPLTVFFNCPKNPLLFAILAAAGDPVLPYFAVGTGGGAVMALCAGVIAVPGPLPIDDEALLEEELGVAARGLGADADVKSSSSSSTDAAAGVLPRDPNKPKNPFLAVPCDNCFVFVTVQSLGVQGTFLSDLTHDMFKSNNSAAISLLYPHIISRDNLKLIRTQSYKVQSNAHHIYLSPFGYSYSQGGLRTFQRAGVYRSLSESLSRVTTVPPSCITGSVDCPNRGYLSRQGLEQSLW